MYALCVSGAVNMQGFVWKCFYALYINFHSFIHSFISTTPSRPPSCPEHQAKHCRGHCNTAQYTHNWAGPVFCLRKYLWWSFCTLYLLACKARVTTESQVYLGDINFFKKSFLKAPTHRTNMMPFGEKKKSWFMSRQQYVLCFKNDRPFL